MSTFLEEFASSAFSLSTADRGVIVVLWGYFDESGTDGQQPHTIISGFAAPLEVWSAFRADWRDALDREQEGMTFHYKACKNGTEDYQGWKFAERRLPHLAKMAEVLSRHDLIAVSAGHSGDFKAVMDRHPDWKTRFPTAYSLCFELLINLLRTKICPINGEQIALILSDQADFSPRAMEVYGAYKRAKQWPELTVCSYGSPKICEPLQAADMIANETRRFVWKENEDEEYWRLQPFLKRWLDLSHRGQKATFSERFDDAGLELFLSQEKGQYLETPTGLEG